MAGYLDRVSVLSEESIEIENDAAKDSVSDVTNLSLQESEASKRVFTNSRNVCSLF